MEKTAPPVQSAAPVPPASGPKPDDRKPQKKTIEVPLHGHVWKVHPMKCRNSTVYRVYHRVNGERKPKNFSSLAKAKADAKAILRELYGSRQTEVHMTEDDKRDWHAATGILQSKGIRSSLETVARHYGDLAEVAGGASLLTDIVRKHASSRVRELTPVKLSDLRGEYLKSLRAKGRSKRYREAQKSHTGQFVKQAGNLMSDQVSREVLQDFIDRKKKVGARAKHNLLDAVKAMMSYGVSQRRVPTDWDEADHVTMPAIQPKPVPVYTAEELTKLLAAAPDNYVPILALAAFAGLRSSELELLDWKHIRLREKDPKDWVINLDVDVTEESSKRSILVEGTLWQWLAGPSKTHGGLWTGTHDDFYRTQQTIAKAAGVEWRQNALRHTAISAKVALHKDVGQVAYESGNSVAVIKRHYLNLLPPSLAQAWFGITPSVVHEYKKELAEAQRREKAAQRESTDYSPLKTGPLPEMS